MFFVTFIRGEVDTDIFFEALTCCDDGRLALNSVLSLVAQGFHQRHRSFVFELKFHTTGKVFFTVTKCKLDSEERFG